MEKKQKKNETFDLIKITTEREGILHIYYSDNFMLSVKNAKNIDKFGETLKEFFNQDIDELIKSFKDMK